MTPFENKQRIKEQILKAYFILPTTEHSDIVKSTGEGSRGGTVIGHTKSGKPIYYHFDHHEHKNFSIDDHGDARQLHHELSEKAREAVVKSSKDQGHHKQIRSHHREQGNKHFDAAFKVSYPNYKKGTPVTFSVKPL